MATPTLSTHIYTPTSSSTSSLAYTLYTPLTSFPLSTSSQGPSSAKPTVVLLPFWGGTAQTYRPLQLSLAKSHPHHVSIAITYPSQFSTISSSSSSVLPAPSQPASDIDYANPNPATNTDPNPHSVSALAQTLSSFLLDPTIHNQHPNLPPLERVLIIAHSMSAKIILLLSHLLSSPSPSFFPSAASFSASTSASPYITDSHSTANHPSIPASPSVATPLPPSISALILLSPAPPSPLTLPPDMRTQQLTAYSTLESAKFVIANVLTHRKLEPEIVENLAKGMVAMSEGGRRGWIEGGMGEDLRPILTEMGGDGDGEYALARKDEDNVGGKKSKERKDRETGETGGLKKSEGLRGLEGVNVKVLVGREDIVETPERVEREVVDWLRRHGVSVDMRVLEGCGHLVPLEAQEEVEGVVGEMLKEIGE